MSPPQLDSTSGVEHIDATVACQSGNGDEGAWGRRLERDASGGIHMGP